MTITAATRLPTETPIVTGRLDADRSVPRVAWLIAAAAGFAVLVAVLYSASVQAGIADSDGATVVLQGQSMSAGHLTLHGWAMSLDSFWTVDALFYTLTVLVTGVQSSLPYLVPALIAAVVVVVGALLARDVRRGAPGVAAAATVVALLGLPSYVLSIFLLKGPWHIGTALWCLVAFAGLRRGRFGWGWVVAVVFLALGLLGDFQIVVLGLAPALAAGVVAMLRTRTWREGMPAASAPFGALLLAGVLRSLALIIGTFTIGAGNGTASRPQMRTNVGHVVTWSAHMFGVGVGPGLAQSPAPTALETVHALGLIAVIAGVVVATSGLIRGAVTGRPGPRDSTDGWRIDDLLVFAWFADMALFVVIAVSDDRSYSRYLTAAVIFGAVLAGRLVGRLAANVDSARLRRAGAVVGIAAIGAFAAALAINVTGPRPYRPYAGVGRFLAANQLHNGIGDYWSASVITVATNDVVKVRPVTADPSGRVVRYQKQSTDEWYARQQFEFLVFDAAKPWDGVDATSATRTFGPPAHTYRTGTYRVLVWSHPISVSENGFAP
jgi:hypothetical protein